MSSEEVSALGITKLDGMDFAFWKMQIEDYLYSKKLHQPLGNKPEGMKEDEWNVLDRQVLGVIRLTLSKNVAHTVKKETTTVGLMKALSDMYEKPSSCNKVHLMKKLFYLKMAEGGSVMEHLNKLNMIINQLVSVEINFDDEVCALILLASLPNSWEPMRAAVSNSIGTAKLKFNDVRDNILAEEVRRRDSGEASPSNLALNVENRGRSSDRNSNKGNGNRGKSRNGRSKSRNRRNVECWNCGRMGHFKNKCKFPKRDDNGNDAANVITDEVHDALSLCVDSHIDSWVLDSGASFHTTAHREIMENYVAGDFGKVYLADGEPLDVVGVGDVKLRMTSGSVWKIQKVKHVPKLMRNLISVGQLDDEGHNVTFNCGSWKVTKGAMVVARGNKTGTLYMTSSCRDTVAIANSTENSSLWHCRLGHMSEKGMKMLHSRGRLPDLKSVEHNLCEGCVFGKQKRVSFVKTGREPKATKLELVHTDVWGPSTVTSLGGSNYYVTFIDDSSRKVWVYFLKNKSDVFDAFKRWRALVENETDLKIKCLQSDNGGEYLGDDFKRYCAEAGIKMRKTIPGTPQQNGVAERMNRTLNERARSMRLHAGLPKMFWAEAISTAAFLINRGPSTPLNFEIPEEVWSGKEVKLSFLKVFGCLSYIHVDANARSKLDAKSKRCFFIGYGDTELGYRFWDDRDRKVIRSKDVIFNEDVLYKDKLKEDTRTTSVPAPNVIPLQDIPVHENEDTGDGEHEDVVPEEEQRTPVAPIRRSSRTIREPQRYSPALNYILLTDKGEPESYDEAVEHEESVKWELAMKDEMESLLSNQTWQLAELPKGKKALHNKWVYRIKEEHDGMKRYKARLVVKGFQQKEGIDYTEIFSPVVKLTTIRAVLAIVAREDLHLEQLDVKTAFLHGDLEEEIYMVQPQGFAVQGKERMVCKLQKSLYGLKQAPRQWYKRFDNFMVGNGFSRCQADHCCYMKNFGNSCIILLLYVDDMLIAGQSKQEIDRLKMQLSKEFAMKDLGAAKQILGMRITRNGEELKLSQEDYVKKVLSRFNMHDAKSVSTPLGSHFKLSREQSPSTDEERAHMEHVPYASAIGSLMYATVCTRPDIAQAVGVVSRYMSCPGKQHWEAVKWILRYLRGTAGYALYFRKNNSGLQGYVDADMAGDLDGRKSTTGYVYTMGGTAISWVSKLQKIVALSTTEAEYVAVTEASKEMVWLRAFFEELGQKVGKSVLHCDSQSAIHLAKNPVYHARTKHIQVRYHYIRSVLEDGVLTLEKIDGSLNPADMFTKTVQVDKLKLCATSIGLLKDE